MAVLRFVEAVYVTEDRVQEWRSTNQVKKMPLKPAATRFVYELCWAVVKAELPYMKCRVALEAADLIGSSATLQSDDVASILADTIAHMGQELSTPGELRSRLIDMAKWLTNSGLIPIRLLQERCEEEFLHEAEMWKLEPTEFKKKAVRVNTRLIYTQTKFNLLREESEGYAKLITMLNQPGPDSLSDENAPLAVEAIKSLIGHFDLDPNRVFDIVLDSFELQPKNTAFLNLIPLFPKAHGTHILGFKFQYYQRPDVTDPVPDSLYLLAGMLIKKNLMEIDGIYVHLTPDDEEAAELYKEAVKARIEEVNKIGRPKLTATGKDYLGEEPQAVEVDLHAPANEEVVALRTWEPHLRANQKLGLLQGLLAVEDWPHAHTLLKRLAPLNPVAHLPICYALCRAIDRALEAAYLQAQPPYLARLNPPKPLQLLREATALQSPPKPPAMRGGEPMQGLAEPMDGENGVGGLELVLREMGRGGGAPEKSERTGVAAEVFEMLAFMGPYLHRDVILLQKICRALCWNLIQAEKGPQLKEVRERVAGALEMAILPSLQLIVANPAVCIQIWKVLERIPYEMRYRLYGEWEKEDEKLPALIAARQIARLDTRRILKRLAKENLKPSGRVLAKLAHANPLTVLRTIVHQVEAYKEMIAPVVDAFKYFNQLEFDILEYVVVERLSLPGRRRVKDDGCNLADWLQCLATFWGTLCKRYASMELRGLFQYLVAQLKLGEGNELIFLQELIQQMACVEFMEGLTDEQLEALSGGDNLRQIATSFGQARNQKASALAKHRERLREALLPRDEAGVALPLLILIAQQRTNIVMASSAPHIKLVGEQLDRCHATLLQYVEFLTLAVTPSTAYAQLVPSLYDLVNVYHLPPEVAFLIYRPVLRLFKPHRGAASAWPSLPSQGGAPAEANGHGKAGKEVSKYKETGKDGSGEEVKEIGNRKQSAAMLLKDNAGKATVPEENLTLDLGSAGERSPPVTWEHLVGTVRSILPEEAWAGISPELYLVFWGLQLGDLHVPADSYAAEQKKLKDALTVLETNQDNSSVAIQKRKKEKERLQEAQRSLDAEQRAQERHVASVAQRLAREKDTWLARARDWWQTMPQFVHRCVLPRALLSAQDALYCARFIQKLHELATPYFNVVMGVDNFICRSLHGLLCCCTDAEAKRLGRFLSEILILVHRWKSDEALYERECQSKPGFASGFKNAAGMTFSQFRKINWKWNGKLVKVLTTALESTEYMDIRNALIVLSKIVPQFPATRKSGVWIDKRVQKLRGEERQDLSLLATSVSAALAARKSSWVSDEEFGGAPPPSAKPTAPKLPSVSTKAPPPSSSTPSPAPAAPSAVPPLVPLPPAAALPHPSSAAPPSLPPPQATPSAPTLPGGPAEKAGGTASGSGSGQTPSSTSKPPPPARTPTPSGKAEGNAIRPNASALPKADSPSSRTVVTPVRPLNAAAAPFKPTGEAVGSPAVTMSAVPKGGPLNTPSSSTPTALAAAGGSTKPPQQGGAKSGGVANVASEGRVASGPGGSTGRVQHGGVTGGGAAAGEGRVRSVAPPSSAGSLGEVSASSGGGGTRGGGTGQGRTGQTQGPTRGAPRPQSQATVKGENSVTRPPSKSEDGASVPASSAAGMAAGIELTPPTVFGQRPSLGKAEVGEIAVQKEESQKRSSSSATTQLARASMTPVAPSPAPSRVSPVVSIDGDIRQGGAAAAVGTPIGSSSNAGRNASINSRGPLPVEKKAQAELRQLGGGRGGGSISSRIGGRGQEAAAVGGRLGEKGNIGTRGEMKIVEKDWERGENFDGETRTLGPHSKLRPTSRSPYREEQPHGGQSPLNDGGGLKERVSKRGPPSGEEGIDWAIKRSRKMEGSMEPGEVVRIPEGRQDARSVDGRWERGEVMRGDGKGPERAGGQDFRLSEKGMDSRLDERFDRGDRVLERGRERMLEAERSDKVERGDTVSDRVGEKALGDRWEKFDRRIVEEAQVDRGYERHSKEERASPRDRGLGKEMKVEGRHGATRFSEIAEQAHLDDRFPMQAAGRELPPPPPIQPHVTPSTVGRRVETDSDRKGTRGAVREVRKTSPLGGERRWMISEEGEGRGVEEGLERRRIVGEDDGARERSRREDAPSSASQKLERLTRERERASERAEKIRIQEAALAATIAKEEEEKEAAASQSKRRKLKRGDFGGAAGDSPSGAGGYASLTGGSGSVSMQGQFDGRDERRKGEVPGRVELLGNREELGGGGRRSGYDDVAEALSGKNSGVRVHGKASRTGGRDEDQSYRGSGRDEVWDEEKPRKKPHRDRHR